MAGSATEGVKTILHPVTDLAAAKATYIALLGMEPTADSPYYVGSEAEGQQIGLVQRTAGHDLADRLLARGRHRGQARRGDRRGRRGEGAAKEVGGGRLVATFTDPDGNVLGLVQDR